MGRFLPLFSAGISAPRNAPSSTASASGTLHFFQKQAQERPKGGFYPSTHIFSQPPEIRRRSNKH
ncbi:MAG TPA: hypothetical protein DHW50_04695 [Akkermansia sp.]|nr:hypothetical protein CXU18_10720 [Akkermansia muciniphila]PNC24994.1 hypothetical protein CXU19_03590 [Akkermansia muciniphila]PNC39378.1 hypothetical protein CXU20_07940 [Akkermansia muciniphila]QUY60503.1 hypothetical protein DMI77_12835 [Akkermansia muciniphila]HCL32944.1 hypothetical protein [Akkermansia sp.]